MVCPAFGFGNDVVYIEHLEREVSFTPRAHALLFAVEYVLVLPVVDRRVDVRAPQARRPWWRIW